MRRLHLFEFEDQPWLPAFLRNAMTAYLAAAYKTTGIPLLWARQLAEVIEETGAASVVDLGSGSSGPISLIAEELYKLGHPVRVLLTDYFPRPEAVPACEGVAYWTKSVDARSVPEELQGLRTMFASFHHFNDADAVRILSDAARKRVAIAIFEGTARTAPAIGSSVLIPLLVLLLTPRIPDVSWKQLLFTYLIPMLPLLIFWDGLVSHLRTRSAAEMLQMARTAGAPGYRWRCGAVPVKRLPGGLPFLIGWPDSAG